ncbi:hypothetical protein CC2G_003878 [Coprinopsis cinerea AmutBmut pab1-1]|nr:hypothetical protein CC2G_003878 [Coprinopsis cinerea AmutBmut pab1-1]
MTVHCPLQVDIAKTVESPSLNIKSLVTSIRLRSKKFTRKTLDKFNHFQPTRLNLQPPPSRTRLHHLLPTSLPQPQFWPQATGKSILHGNCTIV